MSDDCEPTPASVPPDERADERFDGLIERWWADHFPGSAVARDTLAWNAAHAAKESLKRLLAGAQRLPQATVRDDDLQGSV